MPAMKWTGPLSGCASGKKAIPQAPYTENAYLAFPALIRIAMIVLAALLHGTRTRV